MKYEWPDDRLMQWSEFNALEYVAGTPVDWCVTHRSVRAAPDKACHSWHVKVLIADTIQARKQMRSDCEFVKAVVVSR